MFGFKYFYSLNIETIALRNLLCITYAPIKTFDVSENGIHLNLVPSFHIHNREKYSTQPINSSLGTRLNDFYPKIMKKKTILHHGKSTSWKSYSKKTKTETWHSNAFDFRNCMLKCWLIRKTKRFAEVCSLRELKYEAKKKKKKKAKVHANNYIFAADPNHNP